MTFSKILVEKKDSIVYLTVNRPKVLNALNMAPLLVGTVIAGIVERHTP